MTTPLDIISLALKDCGVLGVGQAPQSEDLNDSFTKLNWMIAQWARKRWLIYHLVDKSVVSTGAQSYSIGPGGAINMAQRPNDVEFAFVRLLNQSPPNQTDYDLTIIKARESYDQITLKKLSSFPSYLFYDSAYPLGLLYPWPVPSANLYELHVTVKETLSQFTSVSQTIVLPPEYEAAIHFNLTLRLGPGYQRPPPDPSYVGMARDSLQTIRVANAQIATLRMPDAIASPGSYNIYSDQWQ